MQINGKLAVYLLFLMGLVQGLPQFTLERVNPVWLRDFKYEAEFQIDWPVGNQIKTTQIFYRVHEKYKQNIIVQSPENGTTLRGRPDNDRFDNFLAEKLNITGIKLNDLGKRTVVVALSHNDSMLDEYMQDANFMSIPGNDIDVEIVEFEIKVIADWVSILPVIFTIVYALATQEVLVALMVGVYSASVIGHEFNPWFGFLRFIDQFLIGVFKDMDHIYVILFAWFLAGMVACMQKIGGATGLARSIASFAASRRLALLCSWILGLLIFFDDYTNCLVVGSTMRPVTDAFLISREKLAFVIDATAAPVTSIVPISSWIGFELTVIEEAIKEVERLAEADGIKIPYNTNPFLLFLKSIPARFYPIAMIVLVFTVVVLNYDMGPMLWAERRANEEHKVVSDFAVIEETDDNEILEEEYDTPTRWWNSVVPIATVTIGTIIGIIFTGLDNLNSCDPLLEDCKDKSIENVIGNGDPFRSLLWAAAGGSLLIWILSSIQHKTRAGSLRLGCLGYGCTKQMTSPVVGFFKAVHIWLEGMKSLMGATMVLILAWALSNAIRFVGTDRFIAGGIGANLDKRALPTVTFLVSAAMGFATGTSWGTMTIMFPIATQTAYSADPTNETLMVHVISSILAGAVWGDHCTFISDTTILSSLSARCDVRHHVLTQMPYALLVGIVATIMGDICVGYGVYPDYVGLIVTIITVVVLFLLLGAPVFSRRYDLLTFIVGGLIFWRPCQTMGQADNNDFDSDQEGARMNNERTEDSKKAQQRLAVQRMMMDGSYAGQQSIQLPHMSQLTQRPSLGPSQQAIPGRTELSRKSINVQDKIIEVF
eukprot:TRINITY_DN4503_c0_g1_i2.p1 TRINITY_DN4503_c0_g1~~TRINITY_DN4503_c0_g1_i2.p1  ORF type:complete len:824 (+),score=145.04 TRINITY_DN4503_c0_g1_i2:273-2744(+)